MAAVPVAQWSTVSQESSARGPGTETLGKKDAAAAIVAAAVVAALWFFLLVWLVLILQKHSHHVMLELLI